MTSEAESGKSLGRYQLLFMLGQGGMGEVHLARLSGAGGFEKLCIVKTILPHMQADPQFVDRFHHEARVLVHLNHSNIAQVYDMGDVDGTLYMAIEYVPGVDLSRVQSRMASGGTLMPLPIALFLGQRVADALGYAHRKTGPDGAALGIVHRDVSPQNVMVSYEGEVKVIDFGLAKSAGRSKHTLPATVMGKLGYMSPEQAMAQPVDHRSDIYSAGIVVWEMIAGRPLFEGGTMGEMVVKMAQPNAPPLRTVREEVSATLEQVVARALAPDPAARYSRADDFSRALNELAVREGLSISAEDVGNYVRSLCTEEFAAERALQSKLSVMRKRGAPLATPFPGPEIEGTILKPSGSGGAPVPLTAAQKALSGVDGPARGQSPRPSSPRANSPSAEFASEQTDPPSGHLEVPRSKAPWIVVGVLGLALASVVTAIALKSQEPAGPVTTPTEEPRKIAEPTEPKPEPVVAAQEEPTDAEAAPEPKPIGTVEVKGVVFPVKQGDDDLLVLLKDPKALKKGDQLQLIGAPDGTKRAALYAEGVVLSVKGRVAELGVYDEAPLPTKVFATKDLKATAPTAQRTVGKPKKSVPKTAPTVVAAAAPDKGAAQAVQAAAASPTGQVQPTTANPVEPAMAVDNPFDKSRVQAKVEPVVAAKEPEVAAAADPNAVKQLLGTVQLRGMRDSGTAVLMNNSRFSINDCQLRLPGGLQYRYPREVYSGVPVAVALAGFSPDPRPADPQFQKGWVPIYCREGRGYLKLIDDRR